MKAMERIRADYGKTRRRYLKYSLDHAIITLDDFTAKVDNGGEAADNHLPTYRAERSFAALFVKPIFRKIYRKYQKTDTFTGAVLL